MGSELRLYDVTVGGHKTRMRLDDADAEAHGDSAVLVQQQQPTAPEPADTKSRLVTSNKMRGTAEANAHNERGAD